MPYGSNWYKPFVPPPVTPEVADVTLLSYEDSHFRQWINSRIERRLQRERLRFTSVEELVEAEAEGNPFQNGRGAGDIWRRVERDVKEQEAL
ncbi:hypothetical protein LZ30DRAFT_742101 [Colletotrichum cereale]|nr:hypothetical protein LZ30DRAFT_742101 [Colletotrichum cereale]